MRSLVLAGSSLLLLAGLLAAQSARDLEREHAARMVVADSEGATVEQMIAAAASARFLRDFRAAQLYLRSADAHARTEGHHSQILGQRLWLELATGGGVAGAQARFDEEFDHQVFPPTVIAGWTNNFPELLVGGRFDSLIQSLAPDAEDESFRCTCYAQKAWMHRAGGRMEQSRIYWDSLVTSQNPPTHFANPFDEADWRVRRARDLARAGRADEATEELARAGAVDVSAVESVFIRRRRAQARAELGDVEGAVEDLSFLLSVPSQVTRYTLRDRLTWAPVRQHPAFQRLLMP